MICSIAGWLPSLAGESKRAAKFGPIDSSRIELHSRLPAGRRICLPPCRRRARGLAAPHAMRPAARRLCSPHRSFWPLRAVRLAAPPVLGRSSQPPHIVLSAARRAPPRTERQESCDAVDGSECVRQNFENGLVPNLGGIFSS